MSECQICIRSFSEKRPPKVRAPPHARGPPHALGRRRHRSRRPPRHRSRRPPRPQVLPCGHTFCLPCVSRWFEEARSRAAIAFLARRAEEATAGGRRSSGGSSGSRAGGEEDPARCPLCREPFPDPGPGGKGLPTVYDLLPGAGAPPAARAAAPGTAPPGRAPDPAAPAPAPGGGPRRQSLPAWLAAGALVGALAAAGRRWARGRGPGPLAAGAEVLAGAALWALAVPLLSENAVRSWSRALALGGAPLQGPVSRAEEWVGASLLGGGGARALGEAAPRLGRAAACALVPMAAAGLLSLAQRLLSPRAAGAVRLAAAALVALVAMLPESNLDALSRAASSASGAAAGAAGWLLGRGRAHGPGAAPAPLRRDGAGEGAPGRGGPAPAAARRGFLLRWIHAAFLARLGWSLVCRGDVGVLGALPHPLGAVAASALVLPAAVEVARRAASSPALSALPPWIRESYGSEAVGGGLGAPRGTSLCRSAMLASAGALAADAALGAPALALRGARAAASGTGPAAAAAAAGLSLLAKTAPLLAGLVLPAALPAPLRLQLARAAAAAHHALDAPVRLVAGGALRALRATGTTVAGVRGLGPRGVRRHGVHRLLAGCLLGATVWDALAAPGRGYEGGYALSLSRVWAVPRPAAMALAGALALPVVVGRGEAEWRWVLRALRALRVPVPAAPAPGPGGGPPPPGSEAWVAGLFGAPEVLDDGKILGPLFFASHSGAAVALLDLGGAGGRVLAAAGAEQFWRLAGALGIS